MSDGDGEPTETPEDEAADLPAEAAEPEADADAAPEEDEGPDVGAAVADARSAIEGEEVDEAALAAALEAIETAVEAAGTEAELDDVEAALDDVADALAAADLPEPDEDDEEAADPRTELEGRVSDLRDGIEESRGPYAEDAIEELQSARATVEETRWTETGVAEAAEAVERAIESVGEVLGGDPTVEGENPEELAEALDDAIATIDDADLHPDEDAATVADLVAAAETLVEDLEAAEAWEDLTTREQLDAEGFYDVLEHHKDYPPEWSALKVHEQRGNAGMVLLALEQLDSEFMEEHCLDALRRMGPEEAIDPMLERAERRDRPAIEILGKIAAEEAVDAILEYVETDSDPQLQKTTIKALGEIGSREATQAVANALVADDDGVRSHAARALGMIGDTRAVEPLTDVLEDDDSDVVRASAAWALVQIGTEAALEAASEHDEDRAYLVAAEAETAASALGARPA